MARRYMCGITACSMLAAVLPVTFPFREVLDHVVVDIDFGDGRKLPFMFDIGAPTLISEEIAATFGGEVPVDAPASANIAPSTAGNMGHVFLKNFVATFD